MNIYDQILEKDLLRYEGSNSLFSSLVFWNWGQKLAAKYFVWKVRRKYINYLKNKHFPNKIILDKRGNICIKK